ncbi:hypothetical protein OKA05_02740 [Luteolibacter arcticus]|uniref:Nucleotidyl transferase AbiEii/AbiGii toxin family protein n=1 Tax=Luteolibacter arcticus TaxID=1581411 RepID=A0ABT3GCU3_9BACT|nr:hypothetical protein [Luteolibacter arcticus]MCW1921452.1 hypothetical protein [Luteolibacter arcticus]
MGTPSDRFIRQLTAKFRVIEIGGLAVVAHGLDRKTKDADIWLEPMINAGSWSRAIEEECDRFGDLLLQRLPGWVPVRGTALAEGVEETGMIRISGLDCPLDVFRKPNEVELEAFDGFFERGRKRSDGLILPHPLDLIETKLNTGRDQDLRDIQFLEDKVRAEYRAILPSATITEARYLLDRYSEWQVLQAALQNPSPEVRELATTHLREFAEAGDPFSLAILEGREIP